MLTIKIPPRDDAFDEKTNSFVKFPGCTLKLEHSLLSVTKWEQKHHKYFLGNRELTSEEALDYIKCMTLNQVEDYVYAFLTNENVEQIKAYIDDPMTATWFSDDPNKPKPRPEIVTAEVIYSSMIILNIPVELFEKRHINHLLTLIKVCNEKQNVETNKKNSKVNEYETLKRYSEINRARKAKLGTKG